MIKQNKFYFAESMDIEIETIIANPNLIYIYIYIYTRLSTKHTPVNQNLYIDICQTLKNFFKTKLITYKQLA